MNKTWAAFCLIGLFGAAARAPAAPPLDLQYRIVAQFQDDAGPAVLLANGKVYRLDRPPTMPVHKPPFDREPPSGVIEQIERSHPGVLPKWFTTPKTIPKSPKTTPSEQRPPAAADVYEAGRGEFIRIQDNVPPPSFEIPGLATRSRNQGSARNACTWFAATLALEAAYIRLAQSDVDLSEQYFNHLLKMHLWYAGTPLPLPEVQVGLWGGGSVVTNFTAMTGIPFGIPLESLDPYVSLAGENVSSTRPAGDILIEDGSVTTQRAVDDINLPDTPVTLLNPAGTSVTPLAVRALENANFRSTAFDVASAADRQSLDWYRQRISSGHAIAILFKCCGTQPSGAGGVWTPTGDLSAAHAAVLIGYDDSKNAFLLRNSWGENSARLFSYDFMTGGSIFEAVDVTGVAPLRGSTGLPDNPAILLGRWFLTDAGQPGRITPTGTGMLDIYRIPGADKPATVARLGTFFAEDGSAMRVNGNFVANAGAAGRLEFWIDNSNPDQAASAVTGSHFLATHMFVTTPGNQHMMMVGNVTPPTGPATSHRASKSPRASRRSDGRADRASCK